MEIKIIRAGQFTTLQDLGRRGFRAAGVPWSGAMDEFALRTANLLVGNAPDAVALEFAYTGPELEFSADAIVATTGAECEGLAPWRPRLVRAGETLKLGPCRKGCYGYLAVSGGFEVRRVLGSGSTYVRAAIGGNGGRALRDGDVLQAAGGAFALDEHWSLDGRILPDYSAAPTLRVIRGRQAGEFGTAFWREEFTVLAQSDRMGLRLGGAKIERSDAEDLLSSAVGPGTIQVPPDGQPIVLMADAQTLGGYPQIGHVIRVDLPVAAQLRPGDKVRFAETTVDEAHRLWLARERALGLLREGLALKRHQ